MAYTLASIRNRVLDDKLDDTEFDPEIVDRFINDTQRSLFNTYELPFMEKTFTGVMIAGEHIFELPVDYQVENALILTTADKVRDLTRHYVDFRDFIMSYPNVEALEAAPPSIWTSYGNKIYFSRPLDEEHQVQLWYLKKPILLSADGDVPELPEEFEELLVLGAYIRVLERNEDLDLALYYKNGDYQDELDKLESRLGRRQTGTPTTMGQPMRVSRGRRSGRR